MCSAIFTIIDVARNKEFQEEEKQVPKANARTPVRGSTGGVAALPRTAHTETLRIFCPDVKES